MTQRIVIVGAGGFGRQCVYLIEEINLLSNRKVFEIVGFIDDALSKENARALDVLGVQFLGNSDDFLNLHPESGLAFTVSIANAEIRQQLVKKFISNNFIPVSLIHPEVRPHSSVNVGQGVIIAKGTVLDPLVTVGNFVHINKNCTVGHDAVLGDYATLSPLVSIGGFTRLNEGSFIGANAAVLQNLTVGQHARVGAGACVVKDVPDDVTVKGVPAR